MTSNPAAFVSSLQKFSWLDTLVMTAKAMPSLFQLPLCCQGSTHAECYSYRVPPVANPYML